VKLAIN